MQLFAFDDSYLQRLRAGDFRTQQHFVRYFSELMQIKLKPLLRSEQTIQYVQQKTFTRVSAALRSEGWILEPEQLEAFVNSICNDVLLDLEDEDGDNLALCRG